MAVIPCEQNTDLRRRIKEFSETLRSEAHLIGNHGLSEEEFHRSGLLRGAVERLRGQFSASMREKREFAECVLQYMASGNHIRAWRASGGANRFDYEVELPSGKTAIIELKGCLDGNNTNIFERPSQANEFVIWSICTNPGADPRHNAWSGIHTRLSAEVISRTQPVDGVIIWDMVCGSMGRPCPKLAGAPNRRVRFGAFELPPPCLYVMPSTVPSPRNNPNPQPQSLEDVGVLQAFNDCFGCRAEEINYVSFCVFHENSETMRQTKIMRGGVVQRESAPTAIRRS